MIGLIIYCCCCRKKKDEPYPRDITDATTTSGSKGSKEGGGKPDSPSTAEGGMSKTGGRGSKDRIPSKERSGVKSGTGSKVPSGATGSAATGSAATGPMQSGTKSKSHPSGVPSGTGHPGGTSHTSNTYVKGSGHPSNLHPSGSKS